MVFGGTGASGQQGIYQRFEPPDPCIVMADLNTAIPGGSFGNFTQFFPSAPFTPPGPVDPPALFHPPDPCIRGDTVAFIGSGPAVQGVYARHPPQPCIAIADTTTAVPNGKGSFATFWPSDPSFHPPNPCINGPAVAFWGADASGLQGLYVNTPPDPCLVLVNSSTPIPGGDGAFHTFTALAFQGTTFAFVGGRTDTGVSAAADPLVQQGVYKATVAPGAAASLSAPVAVANLNAVADLNTEAPGGLGTFASFGAVALDPAAVVFDATTSSGAVGLFTDFGGTLGKIVAAGDTLDGKTVSGLNFGPAGFSASQVVFAATFTDGSQSVFTASLSANACPRGLRFWKSQPAAWPAASLELGAQTYSQPELLALLNGQVQTDPTSIASVLLAQQLIAALLNLASGSAPDPIIATVSDAQRLLSRFAGTLPYSANPCAPVTDRMLLDALDLGLYNTGWLTPGCQ